MLAEIEAPDLDQQLLQARADLASQRPAPNCRRSRWRARRTLLASNFVSQQDIDERAADLSNKQAAVNSSQANVERLEALAGYKKITAPFDGVVTERNTDVGALISAGSSAGLPMFVISDISKLRVYVNVPESYVPAIRIGAKATDLGAGISRPAPSLRRSKPPRNRSMSHPARRICSSRLDNADGELMPGGYANVACRSAARRRAVAHSGQRADLRPEAACASRPSAPTTGSCSRP